MLSRITETDGSGMSSSSPSAAKAALMKSLDPADRDCISRRVSVGVNYFTGTMKFRAINQKPGLEKRDLKDTNESVGEVEDADEVDSLDAEAEKYVKKAIRRGSTVVIDKNGSKTLESPRQSRAKHKTINMMHVVTNNTSISNSSRRNSVDKEDDENEQSSSIGSSDMSSSGSVSSREVKDTVMSAAQKQAMKVLKFRSVA